MPNNHGTTSAGKQPAILWRTWVAAALLVLFDGLWIGQGVLSSVVFLWQVVVGLPRWLLSRDPGLKSFRKRRMIITILAAAATMAFISLDIHIAAQRAQTVAQALQRYNSRYGRYPQRLEELVPDILPALPRARLALASDRYYFHMDQEGGLPVFGYTVVAPFGRMMYDFKALRWNALD